ncbi:MAG: hypothetical protein WA139_00525 [Candidatus Aenigmatarchaeota archaeon]
MSMTFIEYRNTLLSGALAAASIRSIIDGNYQTAIETGAFAIITSLNAFDKLPYFSDKSKSHA